MEGLNMLKKYEKYFYIISPVLILISLFSYYLMGEFGLLPIVTLVAGLLIGLLFFLRFYENVVKKVTKRKVRYGINSIVITIVVLAIVVVVFLVTMNRNKRWDLTSVKRFSLSDQTAKVLDRLEGPVTAYAFYSKQMDTTSIVELFTEYNYIYRDFEHEIIDPDLSPAKTEAMGVTEYGTLILEYNGRTEKVKNNNEEGITNTLIKLLQTEVKKVYFVSGHGERSVNDFGNDGYNQIRRAIETENYSVEEILLLRQEKVPDDAAVLIVAGPRGDFEAHEIDLLDEYIQNGGRLLFLMDPGDGTGKLSNVEALLERYGLLLGNDIIIDPLSRVLSGDFFMPVINSYTYNPITKDFNFATFLRLARSVSTKDDPGEDIFARIVASTGESSWAETNFQGLAEGKANLDEGVDIEGPVPVMAYATLSLPAESEEEEEEYSFEERKPSDAVIAAVGDSDFVSNAMYQTQGNKDLFLNTVNFLADRGELISVRPKQVESVYLTMTANQGRLAFFVSVLLVPLFSIAVGIYITIQRRVRS
jgi:ABC-type uncharacterized transport system involved in gliding motility auxiliary subunit